METGQERVSTVFSFRNAGEEPITIERITSTCGCAVAELEQGRYAPGASEPLRPE